MAKAKQIRWECPSGDHPAVLASTRPRLDSIARYCLACSEQEGNLVSRVPRALERQRAQRLVARAERTTQSKALARAVEVVDVVQTSTGETIALDVRDVMRRMLKLPELREVSVFVRSPLPELTVARALDQPNGYCRGRAWAQGRVHLTIGPGCSRERVEELILHELLHYVLPNRTAHGGAFRKALVRAAREWFGVRVRNQGRAYAIDEEIVAAAEAEARGRGSEAA